MDMILIHGSTSIISTSGCLTIRPAIFLIQVSGVFGLAERTYFHCAHLLIAADCSAFACPTFHEKIAKGKVPLLCCPVADFDITTKLEKIFSHNDIASVTVVKMEKSCCADMLEYVFDAAKMSRLPIPIQVTNLFVDAEDVTQ